MPVSAFAVNSQLTDDDGFKKEKRKKCRDFKVSDFIVIALRAMSINPLIMF